MPKKPQQQSKEGDKALTGACLLKETPLSLHYINFTSAEKTFDQEVVTSLTGCHTHHMLNMRHRL